MLAAESLEERRKWVAALRASAEAELLAITPAGAAHGGVRSPTTVADEDIAALSDGEVERRLATGGASPTCIARGLAIVRSRNATCVDCGAPAPDWASINLGAVFCVACSGVHRSMGAHISKVRSLALDDWSPLHVALMMRLGNAAVNELFEAGLREGSRSPHRPSPTAASTSAPTRLSPDAPRSERERFITSKYAGRRWLLREALQTAVAAPLPADAEAAACARPSRMLAQLLLLGDVSSAASGADSGVLLAHMREAGEACDAVTLLLAAQWQAPLLVAVDVATAEGHPLACLARALRRSGRSRAAAAVMLEEVAHAAYSTAAERDRVIAVLLEMLSEGSVAGRV